MARLRNPGSKTYYLKRTAFSPAGQSCGSCSAIRWSWRAQTGVGVAAAAVVGAAAAGGCCRQS